MIHDISPMISLRFAVWPGDTPPSREVLCDLAKGNTITLSTLRSTVHLGSHADAVSHFRADGPAIESRNVETFIGPCQVIRLKIARRERITPAHLTQRIIAPRILFATGTFPDPDNFNEDFASFTPELIDHLAGHGVKLIGIDTPSIDPFDSKDLATHHACFRNDVAILEGLVLANVPEGSYELIALPLNLEGFDASPVRAILREIPKG